MLAQSSAPTSVRHVDRGWSHASVYIYECLGGMNLLVLLMSKSDWMCM